VLGRAGTAAEEQTGANGHAGAVERVEHHRGPAHGQRRAEGGGARGARPRPVGDDDVAVRSRGHLREPIQLGGAQQMGVVHQ
jgi:hypothetical protein